MILARITSQYGDVYFLPIDSSVCRSSLKRFTLNGLFLGIRDTIPLMQPIRLRHRFALLKYVIVFTNSGTKCIKIQGPERERLSVSATWTFDAPFGLIAS